MSSLPINLLFAETQCCCWGKQCYCLSFCNSCKSNETRGLQVSVLLLCAFHFSYLYRVMACMVCLKTWDAIIHVRRLLFVSPYCMYFISPKPRGECFLQHIIILHRTCVWINIQNVFFLEKIKEKRKSKYTKVPPT